MLRREMRKNPGEVRENESLNMSAGRYYARRSFKLEWLQRMMRMVAQDHRPRDLVELLPVLEVSADAYERGDREAALAALDEFQLSQTIFEEFGDSSNEWSMSVRVVAYKGSVTYVEPFVDGRVSTNFRQQAVANTGYYPDLQQLPSLQWKDGEKLLAYSRGNTTTTIYPGGLGSMMGPEQQSVCWYEDLNADPTRGESDDFLLGWYMEIVERIGDSNLRIGRGENRDMKQNPAWATKVIAHTYGEIEAKVDPKWLPKLEAGVHARGNQLYGKLKELGCGAYGCVYPTGDDSIVLKITTDTTEAEFARELATDLVTPVTVYYHKVIDADAAYKNRPVFFLWREEAKKVGKINKEPKYGRRARELIHAQHLAAQVAFELMGHRMKAYKSIKEATDTWRSAAEDMGEVPELRFLARGMIDVLDKNKVFFGDVHEGNLGIVTRNGQQVWAITDPGHVAVVNW